MCLMVQGRMRIHCATAEFERYIVFSSGIERRLDVSHINDTVTFVSVWLLSLEHFQPRVK